MVIVLFSMKQGGNLETNWILISANETFMKFSVQDRRSFHSRYVSSFYKLEVQVQTFQLYILSEIL